MEALYKVPATILLDNLHPEILTEEDFLPSLEAAFKVERDLTTDEALRAQGCYGFKEGFYD